MNFKPPRDDDKYQWTQHVKDKMRYYGISESLIKRIVRFPHRKEEGIAPGTVAQMQRGTNKKKPQEIWTMFKKLQHPKVRIISAWRYPGISPIRGKIPIPDDIAQELEGMIESES